MSGAVWVVEDDRSHSQGIETLLRSHGVDAHGFSDPRRALEEALKEPPRVVITELVMPGLSGVELARELRVRLTSDCPRLILVTGSPVRRADLTLFDQFVRKPFRFAMLLPMVEAYLTPRHPMGRMRSGVLSREGVLLRRVGNGEG